MPLGRRHPAPARSLTASALRLTDRDNAYLKRLSMPWQLRALSYYDTIGEINFTSKFLARQISRVRFYPALRHEDGTLEPIESGAPVELLSQIQDPGGGTSQVQFDYGRLMFITGEGVLFASEEGTRWRFLWKDEVKKMEGRWFRINDQQQVVEEGVGYRIWAPHPRWSDWADAPMRAVQDICEELLLLTLSVRSTTVSRMTKGMVVIPQEIDFGSEEVGMDEDPEKSVFLSDMMEHFQNQKENPGTAAASVPYVVQAPYDYIDGFKWIELHNPATDYMERDLRVEAIKRLALSLDMSPEDLLGYTDANHWTARSVQLDRWRMFGYNKAELWGNAIADAYLRPALRDEGYAGWESVVIPFDDSTVVISPDRTEDALKANKQGLIGNDAAREALGWKKSDAMTEEEHDEWLAINLRDPAIIGEPSNIAPPARGPDPSSNGNGRAEDGPPAPGTNTGVSRQESRTASARVLGAAELALHRCRELAGVRLRYKCPDCAEGHPLSLVASVLGSDNVGSPSALVKGGTDAFQEWLVGQNIQPEQATALGQQLEVYAARTLLDPQCPDLPAGFVASVERAQEVTAHVHS